MKIFVIIVTFNAMHWIEKCLVNLYNSTEKFTLLVIDNGSKDETVHYIQTNFPLVEIIENKENLGFGRANNIGFIHAIKKNANYLFLLNQDVYVNSDTLSKLINFSIVHPSYGILSPVQLNKNGNKLDAFFKNYTKYKTLNEIKTILRKGQIVEDTNFVNAASWLIRIDVLKNVGGFDPIFTHYGEDKNYCNRVNYYKYKIGIHLEAKICHDRYYSKDNLFRKRLNLVTATGLSYLTNINKNLYELFLSWLVLRSKKMIKYLLNLNYKGLTSELSAAGLVLHNFFKIIKSRKISKNTNFAYLPISNLNEYSNK